MQWINDGRCNCCQHRCAKSPKRGMNRFGNDSIMVELVVKPRCKCRGKAKICKKKAKKTRVNNKAKTKQRIKRCKKQARDLLVSALEYGMASGVVTPSKSNPDLLMISVPRRLVRIRRPAHQKTGSDETRQKHPFKQIMMMRRRRRRSSSSDDDTGLKRIQTPYTYRETTRKAARRRTRPRYDAMPSCSTSPEGRRTRKRIKNKSRCKPDNPDRSYEPDAETIDMPPCSSEDEVNQSDLVDVDIILPNPREPEKDIPTNDQDDDLPLPLNSEKERNLENNEEYSNTSNDSESTMYLT